MSLQPDDGPGKWRKHQCAEVQTHCDSEWKHPTWIRWRLFVAFATLRSPHEKFFMFIFYTPNCCPIPFGWLVIQAVNNLNNSDLCPSAHINGTLDAPVQTVQRKKRQNERIHFHPLASECASSESCKKQFMPKATLASANVLTAYLLILLSIYIFIASEYSMPFLYTLCSKDCSERERKFSIHSLFYTLCIYFSWSLTNFQRFLIAVHSNISTLKVIMRSV